MKSNDVNDHSMPDRSTGQVKKPWVTPSLEVIAMESAENGRKHGIFDSKAGSGTNLYS